MNQFTNSWIETRRKIRRCSTAPGGKWSGQMIRVEWGHRRLLEGSDRSGSKAREQHVPSAVGKHVASPKHLAVQIQGARQTQTRNKSTQDVSWGSSTAAGRFLVASQQRSSISSDMSPQRGHRQRGYTLHTTGTRLHSPSLALQLIAHEALFYVLFVSIFISVRTSKCEPLFKGQLHECHCWCKITHVFLFIVPLSTSLVWEYIGIVAASFYPSLCAANSISSCLLNESYLKSAISDVKVKERTKKKQPKKTSW